MFGPAFLISPVLEGGATRWPVYAPTTPGGWYNFWTGSRVPPGATTDIEAPLGQIPVLVKAGSIVPIGPVEQYAGEKPPSDLEIRVYPGADGDFSLYEDEGTNYNYENGQRSTIHFHWNDKRRELSIGQRNGQFSGMLQSRQFKIVALDSGSEHQVTYRGTKMVFGLPK
jgi:alpha-D-xyloside xylohydrolase